MRPLKVWDLPVRMFHWLLVVLIGAAWAAEGLDEMRWHVYLGYTILTLIVFRVLWGLVGSDTARFVRFLKSPTAAISHLAHFRRREPDLEVGHNAAGGWMVMVLLLLVAVQAVTGLFSNDDGNTEGPLKHFVSDRQSDLISHLHSLNFDFIEVAVGLHVAAVLAYAVFKGQNLARPMVTGQKMMPLAVTPPRLVNPVWAVPVLAVAIGFVVWLVHL